MAQRFWASGDAVGHEFWIGRPDEGRAYRVVGVVENAKYNRLVEQTPNFYYVPYQQLYNAQMMLHVLAEPGAESTVATAISSIVREIAPGVPRQPVRSLDQEMQLFFLPQRMAAWVAGLMGVFGLILGAVGVYGVTAFAVGQRTREIGVRLALGARPVDITRLMVRRGLIAPVVGMTIGLALALILTRALTAILTGISATDPIAFGGVALALGTVAVVATLLPVLRATRIDPATTLRSE
jgi:predicted lysophospholipase L1 biosynthesis ABC-type transport system permease subunit